MSNTCLQAAVVKPFLPAEIGIRGISAPISAFPLGDHGKSVTIFDLDRLNKAYDSELTIENILGEPLISLRTPISSVKRADALALQLASHVHTYLGLEAIIA